MPTFTLAELRQEVYSDLDNNTGFYPIGQVNAAINECLYRLNLILGLLQDTIPITGGFAIGGQLIYPTPPGIMIPISVYAEQRELEKCSLRELSMRFRSWAVDTTTTKGPIAHWSPIGIGSFVIHPMSAIGGESLEVQGVTPTTPLLFDGQNISLEDQFAELVVKYARMRVLLKDSSATFSQASGEIYPDWIRTLKTDMLWQSMKFPRFWVEEQLQKNEATGAK